jgi:hypothetical protein
VPIDALRGPSDDPHEAAPPCWERPETVAWFAARPPDERVVGAFPGGARSARVLDAALARHGLEPLHPTHVARATTMRGHRPVLHGHVRRLHGAPSPRTIEETR